MATPPVPRLPRRGWRTLPPQRQPQAGTSTAEARSSRFGEFIGAPESWLKNKVPSRHDWEPVAKSRRSCVSELLVHGPTNSKAGADLLDVGSRVNRRIDRRIDRVRSFAMNVGVRAPCRGGSRQGHSREPRSHHVGIGREDELLTVDHGDLILGRAVHGVEQLKRCGLGIGVRLQPPDLASPCSPSRKPSRRKSRSSIPLGALWGRDPAEFPG